MNENTHQTTASPLSDNKEAKAQGQTATPAASYQSQRKRRFSLLLTEKEEQDYQEKSTQKRKEWLKKMAIYLLMGVIFLLCMYWLFAPKPTAAPTPAQKAEQLIPEAAEIALPSDKEKAYEEDLLAQQQKEKQQALQSLSDYWQDTSEEHPTATVDGDTAQPLPAEAYPNSLAGSRGSASGGNAIASSMQQYRDIHRSLGNFYQDDKSTEQQQLKDEIEELKKQLAEKSEQDPYAAQMRLMEQTYQMASKYLPQPKKEGVEAALKPPADKHVEVYPVYNLSDNPVSNLSDLREVSTDSLSQLLKQLTPKRQFSTVGNEGISNNLLKNSIRACIHTEQLLSENTPVQLRLLEPIRVLGVIIPKGTLLTAFAKENEARLSLVIRSLEYRGRIIPVHLVVYDVDGQQGLYVPYSPDANAFREVAAGIGQSSGSNFSFNNSAKEQILAQTAKGVLQGTTSYIAKKIKRPKIRLKAGYQLLLLSQTK